MAMYYKSAARVNPNPKGRSLACMDCGSGPDCPMLKDEVWETIAGKRYLLCIPCTEKRLGHIIRVRDLNPCLGNAFAFLLFDRFTL